MLSFTDNGGAIGGCGAVALPAGAAGSKTTICSTSSLGAGAHSIVATYGGDAGNNGSTSATVSQVVNTSGTGTSLSSSGTPSLIGAIVTFTATVSGTAPTGNVAFTDGGSTIGGCSAVALPAGAASSKTATCSTSSLGVGAHSIVATYSGDGANAGSTSGTFTQTVNKVSSGTSLTTSGSPSLVGASVTFTATVAGTAPTGSVAFTDGGSAIGGCGAVALPAGAASSKVVTCSTSSLGAGGHSIVATYGGDAGNNGSTSATVLQVVNTSGTGTSLSSSGTPSVVGAAVTFTATVIGTAPTGSVAFADGGSAISGCSAVALPAGAASSKTATCSTSSLSVGVHSIVATYSGDGANGGSASGTFTQTVNKVSSGTSLTTSGSPSLAGAVVTFTATVTGTAPTGSVAFTDGGNAIGGCSAVALPAGCGEQQDRDLQHQQPERGYP